MSSYQDFIKTIENLRAPVAKFRKVALHFHSPDSYDYKEKGIAGKNAENGIRFFSDQLKSVDIDMLAITDHMKCGLACSLSESIGATDICILPGMEINFRPTPPWNKFRLHILAIFPENFALEKVCKILPSNLPNEKSRTGKEEITDINLEDFITQVRDCGGLCIAAHIDTDRGVRRAFRQLSAKGISFYDPSGDITQEEEKQISEDFKEWILTAGFDAIEVGKQADKKHYRWISEIKGKKISIPVLLTNDAHSIDDLQKNDRMTYVKMTSVCFDGLKQALQFPDTRIRFPQDVPPIPSPRIMGIEIISGDTEGFFKKLQAAFSDNLTCLIGPRGSGKSTIIEALRYVFGYNKTLNQIEHPGTDLASKIISLQEATLSNCVIRVVYCQDDNEPQILEAAYDPKQNYTTRVYSIDGEDSEVHDVVASGAFPLRLFGWSEIETLGREPQRQRELLDRLIPDIFFKLDERNKLRYSLSEKRKKIKSTIDNLNNIVKKNSGEIRRYKEYKTDFEKINTEEVRKLFEDHDVAKIKLDFLSQVNTNAQEWIDNVSEFTESDLTDGITDFLNEASDEVVEWWEKAKSDYDIPGKQASVSAKILEAVNILKSFKDNLQINIKKINEEIQDKDKAIREKVSEEAAKQITAELRRTAEERLKRVKKLRREYKKEWDKFQQLLNSWQNNAIKLNDLHDEISGKRLKRKEEIEASLNQFGSKDIAISLSLYPGRDRSEFIVHLREKGILTRDLHGNYKAAKWPEKIAAACTPVELTASILKNEPEKIVNQIELSDGSMFGIDKNTAKRLTATLYPIAYDEDAKIPVVDDTKIMKILLVAETPWDDVEGILLNDRPVEKLSPGQRSSAMLPLIALSENTPLVIDQPEDNLDNRLVGKMLADILADLKEKRQIIVASHNPNIVVSGDAEQVIVLDALSDSEGICSKSGSIDNTEIIHSVVEIMEGGKEAFLARNRRYNLTD